MWRGALIAIGCMAATVPVRPAEPTIVREGDWWVGTLTGSETVAPSGSLRVSGRGNITVTGVPGNRVAWELRSRVKARDMATARARLQAGTVNVSQRNGEFHVMVDCGPGEGGGARLSVPRTLRQVRVGLGDGTVQAYGLDGLVAVATGGGDVKADRIGGDFSARTGGGGIYMGEIGGSARCTTGGGPISARVIRGEAVLETGAGDIGADQIGGLARAATGGGAVRITRAGAGVMVSSGGGQIDVGEARGIVEVRNSGGPVWVGAASGVRCEAAAGAIRLANVSGSLRASTAIGSIVAELLAGRAMGDSFLTTGRGDITVVIPSNVGVKIRAENEMPGSGRRIVSDFPGILTRVVGAQIVAEGDINGGGPLLRISGTGGTIFIRRQ